MIKVIKKIFTPLNFFLASIVLILVKIYQLILSPVLRPSCRYTPTCSQYMMDALKIHGLYGVFLGLKRIIRCNPFCESKHDPVPNKKSSLTLK
ncbi:MAG: membrane protein insertion efficiency factor YidD [Alphaproteobacteria bacterium]|nr:membrane protein insertion efficiency factor YidD [Alphaproteobacteria bacterium]